MPPTLKDGSAPSASSEKQERASENPSASEGISSAQPVTLQVPVTVNGARAVEGSEKREPFSETTSTVLVLANGAVIRLSSSVVPGQLLFLKNEKTKKEVVCQVVKSKNYRSVSGYVELEFTEPVLGFWGMRFPGERHVASSQAGSTLVAERKSDSTALSGGMPAKSAEPKPASYADASPAAASVTSNLADAVEEFKTEIKADSRPTSKADFLAPAETSIDGLKLEANRLQEQLSALLFAEQKQSETKPGVSVAPPSKQELGDAAAKILDMAKEEPTANKLDTPAKSELSASAQTAPRNAQAAVKSSFDEEESKIPAWLEPLARNAAVHAAPADEGASDSNNQFEEWQAPVATEPVSSQKPATTPAKSVPSAPRHTPSAPVFGNTLLGETNAELTRPTGSGKGIWIGIAAGLIVAAASGAWYFRDSLASLAAARTTSQSNTSPATSAAPASSAPAIDSASTVTPSLPAVQTPEPASTVTKSSSANSVTGTPAPVVSSLTQGKMQAAAITERIPKAIANNDVTKTAPTSAEAVEPEIKKPSLGKVRLAKPKVGHSASGQPNAEAEPALELKSETLSAQNSLSADFGESSKQPAAPTAAAVVGGDVKPAHMISSVPPVYPALAKTQHVAGDVRVDALVDATGRVTAMKVVSGPSLLHQAAMDSLRQWKYQAATLDGKPVPMHLTVTIQFRLQ
jgi:TonB family protein